MPGVTIYTDGTNYFTQRGLGQGGGSAPTGDFYVLGNPDFTNLPNSIANPTAYFGADAQPVVAGSLDDEFAGSTLNTSTRWTWTNQGSATATVSKSICFLNSPAHSGTNWEIITQTAPATPWTVQAKVAVSYLQVSAAEGNAGLILTDGSGKLITFNFNNGSGTLFGLDVLRYTNVTTFSGTVSYSNTGPQVQALTGGWCWFQIEDNGTNLLYAISTDGVNFVQLFSESRSAYLASGPTKVGLGVDSETTSSLVGLSCDYFRRTL